MLPAVSATLRTAAMASILAIVRKLTEREGATLAVADHKRNVSDCKDGISSCDKSKLTPDEAGEISMANHQRKVSDCKNEITAEEIGFIKSQSH